MKNLLLLFLFSVGLAATGQAQVKSTFKQVERINKTYQLDQVRFDFSAFNGLPRAEDPFQGAYFSPGQVRPNTFSGVLSTGFMIKRDPATGLPIMVKGKLKKANQPVGGKISWKSKSTQYLNELKELMQVADPGQEFEVVSVTEDELRHTHIRLQQYFGKLEVYGGELILHAKDNSIYLMNGRYYPTPDVKMQSPALDKEEAIDLALDHVQQYSKVVELPKNLRPYVSGPQSEAQLVVYHEKRQIDGEHMAWKIQLVPNMADRWYYFVDAHTGKILDHYNQTCNFFHAAEAICAHEAGSKKGSPFLNPAGPLDGADVANAPDLNGNTRRINTFEIDGAWGLIDVTQPMFDNNRSNIPTDMVGAIATLDAFNTSPQTDSFRNNFVLSDNNINWDPKGVSAHFNAETSYKYFLNTFNRNSINGQGGTVYSFINVADENNEDMDNAFWNGIAMFYGNGRTAFKPFAGSLDVGGHEMSHGVIQNSANLEYVSQSGALNESFADIFGVMIERENWQLGEDIVNTQFFPSGALRDMSNPNNGGSGPGDFRWQPKDMNEFQDLPPTPDSDNGGVHINSGIPNRAFFLFASEVGIEEAEQVYYRALTQYLTRNSQFIDLRNAVIQSATDRNGANSAEVNAARSAFDAVGIVDGQGTPEPEPVPENTGSELLLFSNSDNTSLFLFTTEGNELVNPFQNIPGPLRPPSVTDDGSFILYVANDNTIWGIEIDWNTGNYTTSQISEEAIWGNVSISKDGSRLAATTNDQRNSIFVADIQTGGQQEFVLYNPTYTQGVSTGDVNFADVLQWDFTGEWIMYDALNTLSSLGGDIEYWDIGFINVWNNQSGSFADGFIQKLFSSLGEGISVGNPAFSKNSPNIIALDIFDEINNEYYVYGYDLQTGDQATIFNNLKLGVPSFSLDDSYLIFDAKTADTDEDIIASVNLNPDKITAADNPSIFFSNPGSFGLKWGIIFGNGIRNYNPTNLNEQVAAELDLRVYPNPVGDQFTLELELAEASTLQLDIVDLLGRQVRSLDLGRQNGKVREAIPVAQLGAGTYFLRLKAGKKVVSTKFVKQ